VCDGMATVAWRSRRLRLRNSAKHICCYEGCSHSVSQGVHMTVGCAQWGSARCMVAAPP
jgi:hypothetical protein